MQHIEPQETRYIEAGDVEVHTTVNRARGPLEYSLAYYNHLNQDVTVTLRNGVPFKLPAGNGRKNCFEVLATFSIDPHVGIDPKSVFHNGTSVSPESLALKAALENCEQNGRFNRKSFTLRYSVPAEQVEKNSGTIYIADLDLTVSVSSDERRAIHPYSPSSDRYRLIEAEANVNNPERFGYSLYLISNNGAVMDKYINIGGRVYRVPSIENKSLRDGVYLCSSGCVEAKGTIPSRSLSTTPTSRRSSSCGCTTTRRPPATTATVWRLANKNSRSCSSNTRSWSTIRKWSGCSTSTSWPFRNKKWMN